MNCIGDIMDGTGSLVMIIMAVLMIGVGAYIVLTEDEDGGPMFSEKENSDGGKEIRYDDDTQQVRYAWGLLGCGTIILCLGGFLCANGG